MVLGKGPSPDESHSRRPSSRLSSSAIAIACPVADEQPLPAALFVNDASTATLCLFISTPSP